jgi:transposase
VGRPPADPRTVAICLLIRAIFRLSYRSVYSLLASSREYRQICGIKHLPAYNTVQEHVKDVSEGYLNELVKQTSTAIMRVQRRALCSSACDGTGIATRKYERWFNVRNSRRSRKKRFVKLHAHVTTDREMPFFLSAIVTKGYKNESPRLKGLMSQKSRQIALENVTLDKAFLSRRNAQLIADYGANPVIQLKSNTASAHSKGHPAWNRMIHEAWENKEAYEERYNRRAVIEGVFSAFKHRFGREVASKIRHNQNVEVLCRVVAWNILALAYHSYT